MTYSNKEIGHGLRSQLSINSNDLPKMQIMDSRMWMAVRNALTCENVSELDWISLGPQLSNILKVSNVEICGKLAETAVCSFISDITEEDFLENFGRHEEWQSLQTDLRLNYYRARFASIYWCSVRDYAVKSKTDCLSVFHLPWSFVELLSLSSTSEIIDFCHGFPLLQRFKLTSSSEDCLAIAQVLSEEESSDLFARKLLATKMIKSNHCACYVPNYVI